MVLVITWVLRDRRLQNAWLLVASYVFYGWLSPPMTLLLFGVTASNYVAALALTRWPALRTPILTTTVVASLANLAAFKYFGWFIADIAPRLHSNAETSALQTVRYAVPLGLSFYTFHNLSYTIDVYRGRFTARTNPIDYFLYGAYFPQLVAGPVERASNVLPQLEAPRRLDAERLLSGFGLALWGAFKKLVLADTIAPYVDLVFQADDVSAPLLWSGVLGFTIQVLADFSGYTDIARGVSRMLGIELMENFAHPYLAATPMEYWQRWHISFSTWLRDYVYLPACFSDGVRKFVTIPGTGEWGPFANTTRALLITLLLSGLWHGTTANFLVWGLYYTVLGTIYAAIVARLPRTLKRDARWRWVTVPLMFGWTLVGMHLFREPDVHRLLHHFTLNPFEASPEQWLVTSAMIGLCAYAATPLVAALLYERYLHPWLSRSLLYPAARTVAWAFMVVALLAAHRQTTGDFIYFQF